MNVARRKEIDKALTLLAEARDIISDVAGEEREGFDNLSEGFQASERGQRMDEVASELEDKVDSIQTIEDDLEACKE